MRLYHFVKNIGRYDVPKLVFKVLATSPALGYTFVINGVVQKGDALSQTVVSGDNLYIYNDTIKAGSLVEFYYHIPLDQPDTFNKDTAAIMASKALCRLNIMYYSSIGSLTAGYGTNVIKNRLLASTNGYLLIPINTTRVYSRLELLDTLVDSIELSTGLTFTNAKAGRYYIITNSVNASIQVYSDVNSYYIENSIRFEDDFNVYEFTIPSKAVLKEFKFCGAGFVNKKDVDIPKLPVSSTNEYKVTDNSLPNFPYSPTDAQYKYTKSAGTITQEPNMAMPYNIIVKYSAELNSNKRVLATIIIAAMSRVMNIPVPLQDTAGYYYIEVYHSEFSVKNDYYPYDTSLINVGLIDPTVFWEKLEDRDTNIIIYRTKNKVKAKNMVTGATKMEFMLL